MVKNKYLSMSCEERKNARKEYFATEEGSNVKIRINRLLIYSIILLGFGIYVIIDALNLGDTHLQLFYGIGLIVVAATFFVGRYFVIIKLVNDYLIEKMTKVTVKATKEEKVVKEEVKVEKPKTVVKKAPAKKEVVKETKKTPVKKTTKTTVKKTTTKKEETPKKTASKPAAKKTETVKKAPVKKTTTKTTTKKTASKTTTKKAK